MDISTPSVEAMDIDSSFSSQASSSSSAPDASPAPISARTVTPYAPPEHDEDYEDEEEVEYAVDTDVDEDEELISSTYWTSKRALDYCRPRHPLEFVAQDRVVERRPTRAPVLLRIVVTVFAGCIDYRIL